MNSNINVVGIHKDAIKFDIGVTKTDQTGQQNIDNPFPMYFVPENPVICPVLVFAKYLICNPHILEGNCKLFERWRQYNRINQNLHEIVLATANSAKFKDLGLEAKYFGTYSMCKGAVTIAFLEQLPVHISPPFSSEPTG